MKKEDLLKEVMANYDDTAALEARQHMIKSLEGCNLPLGTSLQLIDNAYESAREFEISSMGVQLILERLKNEKR